ncbi:type II toxin-antitoxin system prevent-host-death family antitoxin [Phenylobacterium sp.]|uniref:type II toxin-antitoxin system Phd/YefM family antitoxin n=1 Tax=Phenylobacterium sp. TaxID=1871053 RepID=UPI00301E34AC
MRISLSEAKAQLTELVRRAEAGEDVVLTRHGHEIVRLQPISRPVDMARRRRALEDVMRTGPGRITPGPGAARSQDFLYDDDGLPG